MEGVSGAGESEGDADQNDGATQQRAGKNYVAHSGQRAGSPSSGADHLPAAANQKNR